MTERVEILVWGLLLVVLAASLWLAASDPGGFAAWFAAEDGPIEYATALLLAVAGGILAARAFTQRRRRPGAFTGLTFLYAAIYLFVAGEEISWGQRIFGLATTDFFARHNDQGELTLHNLVVGEVKLDEVVFGNLLGLVLLLYLLALPFAWGAWGWARRLAAQLAIPVPRPRHAAATLAASLVVVALDAERKWEVYELCFALISLMIFAAPRNAGHVVHVPLRGAARSS